MPASEGLIMQKATVELRFGELGYIANPYWPEIEWLIRIEKEAKINARHGADKKKILLETYCKDKGLPMSEVEAAREKVATQKWCRVDDKKDGNIIIPRHHLSACLVQALSIHPLNKIVDKNTFRSFVTLGDLIIDPVKTKADGIYTRYVKNPESNLRRLQVDEYINNFTAKGDIFFRSEVIEPDRLESLLAFAGEWVGVGSARKMGRGKYFMVGLTLAESAAAA